MILEIDDWHLGYDQIVKDVLGEAPQQQQSSSVWVLANADVDSLAAARILTYMFRADSIPYQLRPCWSYSSLSSMLQDKETAQDISALVLLNLGASRNLAHLFAYLNATTKIYVIDGRKPVHLANYHAGPNIVVFWDETQSKNDIPSDGDNLSGNDSTTDEDDDSSDSDDDDDSDDDEESANPDEGEAEFDDANDDEDTNQDTRIKRHEKYDTASDGDDEDNGEIEDIDDEDNDDEKDQRDSNKRSTEDKDMTPTKRTKTATTDDDATDEEVPSPSHSKDESVADSSNNAKKTPHELHKDRRDRLRGYYSGGTYYGSPAAWMAFRLASQKRWQDNGDLLWLACVGLTDAYIHNRLDVAGYASLSIDLKTSVQRVFPNDMVDRVDKTVFAERLMGTSSGPQTQVTLSENGTVLAETEYRLFLLRHSSLYDSMIYSNYVASRLQVWSTAGKQKLQELLAKMGFPLEECKQPYAFMNPHLKRKLRDKVAEYAEQYGLDKLEFTSFNRVTGYKSLISASDTSYAVSALLESESPDSFHAALEALNFKAISSEGHVVAASLVNGGNLSSSSTGIGAGLLRAKELRRQIVSTCLSLVERNAIIRLRHFRYAMIACSSQEAKDKFLSNAVDKQATSTKNDHAVFGQPLALTRLAQWLMDTHRENGKWIGSKSRPLVLCAERPASQTYLVVGYEFPDRHGAFFKNHFGQRFQMTCQSMQGTFKLDSFDSHVVEVDASDVQRFIEQLHYLMDST